MKVALFTESFTPYISGVTRSVELLKKGLDTLGEDTYVFAPSYPDHADKEKNIYRLPSIKTRYPGFRAALPYPGFIPDLDFDIIHSNSPFQLGLSSMRYARKKKLPFVYTFHTLFTEYLHYLPAPKNMAMASIKRYINFFCNRCDCIITPNSFTANYLSDFGIKARIEMIPSGIDPNLSEKASGAGIREKHGIPASSPVFLYVGRLSKEKNIPFLLKAAKHVLDELPDARFLLAAGGPMLDEFRSMASGLGIADRTVFAGQIPYPKVLDYYKCADVFTFSSLSETQGLVMAEAKSCGLPVVALDSGGIKDSVIDGEDGFLMKSDEKAFSDRVLLLLKDPPLRKRMSTAATSNAERDFSFLNIAKKVQTVYNSLTNK